MSVVCIIGALIDLVLRLMELNLLYLHGALVEPRLHLALGEVQIDEVFPKVHLIRWQGPFELAFDHEEVVVQSMVLVVVLHLNELVILMLVCVIVVRLLSLERYHGRPGGSRRLVLTR